MQELDEQDTCRICSAPAEPDLPLFHPCKCSGTIRYIHQDCLTTWLAHSKKKNCDLCKHPYSFTKVYAPDMPKALPVALLLKRVVHQIVFAILFGLRAIAVAVMWLAVLPWATIWTWRLYFSMGESTAWWISDYPRPSASMQTPNPFYKPVPSQITLPETPSFYTRLVTHPYWLALSADIFAGQIIASLIVLTFVAVFLLREWISQNARPGVFEDEDLIIDDFLPPRQAEPLDPPLPQDIPGVQPPTRHVVDLPLVVDPTTHDPANDPAQVVVQNAENSDRPLKRGRGNLDVGQRIPNEQAPLDSQEVQEERAHLRRRLIQTNQGEDDIDAVPSTSSFLPPGHEDGKFEFTFNATSAVAPPATHTPPPSHLSDSWNEVHPSETDYPQSSFDAVIAGPGPSTLEQLDQANEEDPPQHWPTQATTGMDADQIGEEYDLYFASVPSIRKGKAPEFPKSDDEEDEDEEGDEGVLSQDENWGGGEAELPEAEIHDVLAPQLPVLEGVVNGGGLPPQNHNAAPPQPGAANIPPDVALQDLNEDIEGNVEDDMEGAMEAIGMRGPIYGVLQNAALMIFVLDTAIGLCVWLPFTIGKSAALLSMNPHRLLQILHLPIRAMRLITDPVVDTFFYLLVDFYLPRVFRLIRNVITLLFLVTVSIVELVLGSKKSEFIVDKATELYDQARHLQDKPLDYLLTWAQSAAEVQDPSPIAPQSWLDSSFPDSLKFAEPYFAALGREVRLAGEHIRTTWSEMALGSSPSDRAFAIILGYSVVGFAISIYLNILTVGNARSAGRAVRSAVRQQLLVLKVAGFIFIELVLFPLGCGIVLDLCTVWLFPEANLASRATFFFQAPLTAMFYHWVAGTMFMYTFAILLSGCRSVMRPGAMWFIKDPQDQNSHPIRDILDRPTLTQLRKIFVSGLMYSFVVACVVGSVAGLLLLGSKSIMPFRWKNREPLSNVPIDLLFLHFVLPYTVHYFRPKKTVKQTTTMLWRHLAKKLRLTSYFFGERHSDEEYTPAGWWPFSTADSELAPHVNDGTFRRVPATDNLALPRDIRATAQVHENGEPVDDAARQLIAIQDVEAEKAKRSIKDDYMIVYIPPYFRWRILCFITALWVIGAGTIGVAVALPIQFGRGFFRLFTDRDMHDGYSIIVGFYILWGCYLVGKAIDRLDKRRQRTGGDGPRGDLRIFVIKRGLLWLAKTVYMVTFLGVVIPTLLAMVIDLYILLPFRFLGDPAIVPRIRMVDMWALGLLYMKILLHLPQVQHPPRIAVGIQHIRNNGWTHQDPVSATKEVIGPTVAGLLAMIVVPGATYRVMQHVLPPQLIDNKTIFTRVYPGIFVLVFFARSTSGFYDLLASWSQSIRDKEFLVEMRLRNHEPESEKGTNRHATAQNIEVDVRVG